jgi:hypothetical protein
MGTRRRRLIGLIPAAVILGAASVAWACTPGMVGDIWFCNTTSSCFPSVSAGSTKYSRGTGMFADKSYHVRYVAGADSPLDCHASSDKFYNYTDSTYAFWTTASTGSGWKKLSDGKRENKRVTMPSVPLTYTVCGTPIDGSDPTNHLNLTVT